MKDHPALRMEFLSATAIRPRHEGIDVRFPFRPAAGFKRHRRRIMDAPRVLVARRATCGNTGNRVTAEIASHAVIIGPRTRRRPSRFTVGKSHFGTRNTAHITSTKGRSQACGGPGSRPSLDSASAELAAVRSHAFSPTGNLGSMEIKGFAGAGRSKPAPGVCGIHPARRELRAAMPEGGRVIFPVRPHVCPEFFLFSFDGYRAGVAGRIVQRLQGAGNRVQPT